jgi:signal transduction histidine kinase
VEFVSNVYQAGNVKVIQCNIRDITGRKRAEALIRASEERFRFLNDLSEATRTLADPAQIMAVMARMLGEHLHASRCAYADMARDGDRFTILHDYTDGCVSTVGNYELSLFGPRAVATLNRGQTLIIRNVGTELPPGEGAEMFNAIGIQAIITCPLVKAGRLCALMAVHQATPRDWQPGEIAIVEDVVERCWATIERRAAEEKIQQLNTELEQRVAERTAQLEAANKELEAFCYSVSHDLRAPLRAVNGFAGIVLEEFGPQLPAAGRRYLERIRTGGVQMGMLIDDLLAFSRLSRQPMRQRAVDMNQLVAEALAELEPQRVGRPVELRVANLPASQGDPALLKQVWVNLISNAIKYTRDRVPAVIEIGCEGGPGEPIFFVRDNGAGFDMRYAHKLFGVFQRLHRADEFEGTGVGLAIVQRIIHRHGGRVWAEGEEGRGAIFRFTLWEEQNHE